LSQREPRREWAAARGFAAALILVFAPSCFLPGWHERPWVDDDAANDDVTADDDTADDDAADDDTVASDVELEGTADVHLSYQTMGDDCTAVITGEVNAERTKVDGDGECTIFGYTADVELDCDLFGAAADGTLLVYNEMLPVPLTIPVTGTFEDDPISVDLSGSTSFYGISGNASILMQPIE